MCSIVYLLAQLRSLFVLFNQQLVMKCILQWYSNLGHWNRRQSPHSSNGSDSDTVALFLYFRMKVVGLIGG